MNRRRFVPRLEALENRLLLAFSTPSAAPWLAGPSIGPGNSVGAAPPAALAESHADDDGHDHGHGHVIAPGANPPQAASIGSGGSAASAATDPATELSSAEIAAALAGHAHGDHAASTSGNLASEVEGAMHDHDHAAMAFASASDTDHEAHLHDMSSHHADMEHCAPFVNQLFAARSPMRIHTTEANLRTDDAADLASVQESGAGGEHAAAGWEASAEAGHLDGDLEMENNEEHLVTGWTDGDSFVTVAANVHRAATTDNAPAAQPTVVQPVLTVAPAMPSPTVVETLVPRNPPIATVLPPPGPVHQVWPVAGAAALAAAFAAEAVWLERRAQRLANSQPAKSEPDRDIPRGVRRRVRPRVGTPALAKRTVSRRQQPSG